MYMAQENYEQITREIELQRKEIVEKLEQIKAMEEETQRKEETCLQLQRVYEEQQQVLLVRYRHNGTDSDRCRIMFPVPIWIFDGVVSDIVGTPGIPGGWLRFLFANF